MRVTGHCACVLTGHCTCALTDHYMCVLDIDFPSVSTIFLLDFVTVLMAFHFTK